MAVARFGFWWRYSAGGRECCVSRGGEGFDIDEVEGVAKQVLDYSEESRGLGKYQHRLVSLNNEEFYVLVDSTGNVSLPVLGSGSRGKTKDISKIPGFRDSLEPCLSDINW